MSNPIPKRRRRQLAKAELLMHLAAKAEEWSRDVGDRDDSTIPFAEWPGDDPLQQLAATYDLTGADLAEILHDLGDRLERQATTAGYDQNWSS